VSCSAYGGDERGKLMGPLGRPRHRWEDGSSGIEMRGHGMD